MLRNVSKASSCFLGTGMTNLNGPKPLVVLDSEPITNPVVFEKSTPLIGVAGVSPQWWCDAEITHLHHWATFSPSPATVLLSDFHLGSYLPRWISERNSNTRIKGFTLIRPKEKSREMWFIKWIWHTALMFLVAVTDIYGSKHTNQLVLAQLSQT